MGKVSPGMIRLAVIALVLGVIGHFLTEPSNNASSTGKSKYNHFSNAASTGGSTDNGSGIIPADYTAHFTRYKGGIRNPFLPLISNQSAIAGTGSGQGSTGNWALTGINTIDGVRSALVEDSATGDSDFLHAGDQWNGFTVQTIGDDSVTLVDSNGNVTELSFPVNSPDTSTPNAAGSAAASAPGTLGLPPAPVSTGTGAIPPFTFTPPGNQ